jgi:hypothetical protein
MPVTGKGGIGIAQVKTNLLFFPTFVPEIVLHKRSTELNLAALCLSYSQTKTPGNAGRRQTISL